MLRMLALTLAVMSAGCGSPMTKCDTTSCNGCCTSDGQCQAGTTDAWCGTGGKLCVVCPSKQTCKANACVAQLTACTAANCSGCCDDTGACFNGTSASACGKDGAACTVCGSGKTCTLGNCQ